MLHKGNEGISRPQFIRCRLRHRSSSAWSRLVRSVVCVWVCLLWNTKAWAHTNRRSPFIFLALEILSIFAKNTQYITATTTPHLSAGPSVGSCAINFSVHLHDSAFSMSSWVQRLIFFLSSLNYITIIVIHCHILIWVCVWRLKRILQFFHIFIPFVSFYFRCLHNTRNELRKKFPNAVETSKRTHTHTRRHTSTRNGFYGFVESGCQPTKIISFLIIIYEVYIFATQQ